MVVDWIAYLRTEKLFGQDDPIFPKPAMGVGAAGLRYYHPHLFRHTLVALGQAMCQTPQ